jgi:hypothetical protein
MLPIQGPADPRDDHHEDEQISEAAEIIYRQRECIHDYQEIGGDLSECRHCGHRSRFTNYRGSDRIMMASITESHADLRALETCIYDGRAAIKDLYIKQELEVEDGKN